MAVMDYLKDRYITEPAGVVRRGLRTIRRAGQALPREGIIGAGREVVGGVTDEMSRQLARGVVGATRVAGGTEGVARLNPNVRATANDPYRADKIRQARARQSAQPTAVPAAPTPTSSGVPMRTANAPYPTDSDPVPKNFDLNAELDAIDARYRSPDSPVPTDSVPIPKNFDLEADLDREDKLYNRNRRAVDAIQNMQLQDGEYVGVAGQEGIRRIGRDDDPNKRVLMTKGIQNAEARNAAVQEQLGITNPLERASDAELLIKGFGGPDREVVGDPDAALRRYNEFKQRSRESAERMGIRTGSGFMGGGTETPNLTPEERRTAQVLWENRRAGGPTSVRAERLRQVGSGEALREAAGRRNVEVVEASAATAEAKEQRKIERAAKAKRDNEIAKSKEDFDYKVQFKKFEEALKSQDQEIKKRAAVGYGMSYAESVYGEELAALTPEQRDTLMAGFVSLAEKGGATAKDYNDLVDATLLAKR
jgi:hypothetical protein